MRVSPITIIRCIIEESATEFYASLAEVKKRSRSKSATHARQAAYTVARRMTRYSYPELGRLFNRDHTTVIHGAKAGELASLADSELAASLRAIEERCKRRIVSLRDI